MGEGEGVALASGNASRERQKSPFQCFLGSPVGSGDGTLGSGQEKCMSNPTEPGALREALSREQFGLPETTAAQWDAREVGSRSAEVGMALLGSRS